MDIFGACTDGPTEQPFPASPTRSENSFLLVNNELVVGREPPRHHPGVWTLCRAVWHAGLGEQFPKPNWKISGLSLSGYGRKATATEFIHAFKAELRGSKLISKQVDKQPHALLPNHECTFLQNPWTWVRSWETLLSNYHCSQISVLFPGPCTASQLKVKTEKFPEKVSQGRTGDSVLTFQSDQ